MSDRLRGMETPWWKVAYTLGRQTIDEWLDDDAPTYAAAVAFYAMISLAPVLTIVLKVASVVFGEEVSKGQMLFQVEQFAGVHVADLIETLLGTMDTGSSGVLATLVSLGVMLFGATGVFAQLHTALNRIWGLPRETGGVKHFLKIRLKALGFVFGVGGLLILSISVSTLINVFTPWLAHFAGTAFLWKAINASVSFAILTVLFALLYKLLPDTTIRWRDTWLGGAVTSLLFVIGNFLIGFYLGTAAPGSAYGAAGTLVVFLIWVFYSAQVVLIGAEYTQVYTQTKGREISPKVPKT